MRVLRFANGEIYRNFEEVCRAIDDAVIFGSLGQSHGPHPPPEYYWEEAKRHIAALKEKEERERASSSPRP